MAKQGKTKHRIVLVLLTLMMAVSLAVTVSAEVPEPSEATTAPSGAVMVDVTFAPGEGNTVDPAKQAVTVGEPYGALPVPVHSNANYEFLCWLLDGQEVTEDTVVSAAEDHTLTAKWAVKEPALPKVGHNIQQDLYRVQCTTDESHGMTHQAFIDVNYNHNDLAFNEETERWEVTVEIELHRFVNIGRPNRENFGGRTHYMTDGQDISAAHPPKIRLYWDPDAEGAGDPAVGIWKAENSPVKLEVMCHSQPAKPNPGKIYKDLLWLRDCTNVRVSQKYGFDDLLPGSYELGEVYKEGNAFYCDLTVDAAPYVQDFSAKKGAEYGMCNLDGHTQEEDSNHTVRSDQKYTVKMKYTATGSDYKQDGTGWTWDTTGVNNQAKYNGYPVYVSRYHTVTYSDGVDGQAFASQVTKVRNNGALPAFAGQPTREGYHFLGWDPEPQTDVPVTEDATYTAQWEAHDFGPWEMAQEPDCTHTGSEKQVCKGCGFEEFREVPAMGHEWEDHETVDVPATCTTEGSKSVHCTRCDAVKDTAVIPATGHKWDEGKVTKEPTCTTEGSMSFHCTECDAVKDTAILATGHKWDEGKVTKEPTCTAEGEMTFTCANDPAHTMTQPISKADHSFQWVVDREPTTTAAGSKHEECSVCGYQKPAVEIPATVTPQTGDNGGFAGWLAVLALCAGAAGVLTLGMVPSRKRKN